MSQIKEITFTVSTPEQHSLSCLLSFNPQLNPDLEPSVTTTALINIISSSHKITIISHGLLSSKSSPLITNLKSSLIKISDLIVTFDFRGNGESTGEITFGYMKEVLDLHYVLTYINSIRNTSKEENKVTLIGHSKAVTVALIYASLYKFKGNLILLSGRFNLQAAHKFSKSQVEELENKGKFVWKKKGEKEYVIRRSDLEERNGINLREYCDSLSGIRVLVVHGSKDDVVPVNDFYEYLKGLKHVNLSSKLIEGCNHSYDKPEHFQELISCITEFIAE